MLWFPDTRRLNGGGIVSDPAYRAPGQHSNVHGNGEELSGDAHLGRQGSVRKALIGPRVEDYPENLRLVPHSKMA